MTGPGEPGGSGAATAAAPRTRRCTSDGTRPGASAPPDADAHPPVGQLFRRSTSAVPEIGRAHV